MVHHNLIEKRYDNITKSPNDKREYRGLLLSNKMRVLLISDPTTDKSAAALNVNIGKIIYIVILLFFEYNIIATFIVLSYI